jgi:hypothetical protein
MKLVAKLRHITYIYYEKKKKEKVPCQIAYLADNDIGVLCIRIQYYMLNRTNLTQQKIRNKLKVTQTFK